MKLVISFKDNLSISEKEFIKHTIFLEVYLNKNVSSLNKFKDFINDFNFINDDTK